MFWDNFYELCEKKQKKPLHVVKELNIASGSITAWKNGAVPSSNSLKKLSDYFGVSVDHLLGEETTSHEDIAKSVIFGSASVSDEMWEEIKSYAIYIKQKYDKQ